jgi:hypothetical protein
MFVGTKTNDSRTIHEQTTNKIKLVSGRSESGRIGDLLWAGRLLSGYMLACFELHFPYENVGVSGELRLAILKSGTYSEVPGTK